MSNIGLKSGIGYPENGGDQPPPSGDYLTRAQADKLYAQKTALANKYDKSGGEISGEVIIRAKEYNEGVQVYHTGQNYVGVDMAPGAASFIMTPMQPNGDLMPAKALKYLLAEGYWTIEGNRPYTTGFKPTPKDIGAMEDAGVFVSDDSYVYLVSPLDNDMGIRFANLGRKLEVGNLNVPTVGTGLFDISGVNDIPLDRFNVKMKDGVDPTVNGLPIYWEGNKPPSSQPAPPVVPGIDVHARSYYADYQDGSPAGQDWQSSGIAPTVTRDHLGFPALLTFNDQSNTQTVDIYSDLETSNNSVMWSDGWRWDISVIPSAGGMKFDIHCDTNGAPFAEGIYEMFVMVDGAKVIIGDAKYSNHSVELDDAVNHVLHIVIDGKPNSTIAEVTVNAEHKFDLQLYEQSADGNKLVVSTGSVDRVGATFYLLSQTYFALEDTSHTFTNEEIELGINYTIPTINQEYDMFMPKGTFKAGTQFTIANGSSQSAYLQAQDGDYQLFSGRTRIEIIPGREVTFTQVSAPRGNVWVISEGLQTTPTQEGHTLLIQCNADGEILKQLGTYTKKDVLINKIGVGRYGVAVGGKALNLGDWIAFAETVDSSILKFASAGQGGLGEIAVHTGEWINNLPTPQDEPWMLYLTW